MTAPEPCPCCDGGRELIDPDGHLEPCAVCCCVLCGQPTDTPPDCGAHDVMEEARWKRRADV